VNSEYLAAALRSKPMQAQIAAKTGQVTIGKLALFRIESLVLPLPPLEVQRDFALRIAAVRSARPVLESSASAFGRLFSSLQHLAFRGEL
jgi:type I restriction enzyme S subunit